MKGPHTLSNIEKTIFIGISTGRFYDDIAMELLIPTDEVARHVANVFCRLDTQSCPPGGINKAVTPEFLN